MLTRFYAPFSRVEKQADGTLRISGIASTEAVDSDGEIVKSAAMRDALPDFFRYGTGALREMHGPSAAGTVDDADIDAKDITRITATVVDETAIRKIEKGVYKGLSIGGKVLERDKDNRRIITKIGLYEISLVDRPANPEATFDVWKLANQEGNPMTDESAPADALAKADEVDSVIETVIEAEAVNTEVDEAAKAVDADVDDPVAKAAEALAALKAAVDAFAPEVVEPTAAEKAAADELAKATEAEDLHKAAIAKLEAERDALAKALADMVLQIAPLTKRVAAIEAQPAPAKTAGHGIAAVSKEADAAGGASGEAAKSMSPEDAKKMLDAMSEEDRALALIKAAHHFPRQLNFG
jgi:hypothetical protein